MIIGTPNEFAIESGIATAYASPSLLALGHFVIHIKGRHFGIRKPDATLLAVAFSDVKRRLEKRGQHTAPALHLLPASDIAMEFSSYFFGAPRTRSPLGGVPESEINAIFEVHDIIWAPGGDEAFDDSSCILQIDEGDAVRLIAFTRLLDDSFDQDSLQEIFLPQRSFYSILTRWRDTFYKEWQALPKIVQRNEDRPSTCL